MPAAKKFTEAQLREAALAIVDREGLAALSMRSVAQALGTGAMTLYNYVKGREALEALIVGAVMAEARLPAKPAADWRDDVRAISIALWRTVRRHPNVIPLVLSRRTEDAATLRAVETLLEALARSGRSGFELLVAFRVVSGFVAGFAQSEVAGLLSKSDSARDVRRRIQEAADGKLRRLVEIAAVGLPGNPEREFRAGLDVLLTGLTQLPAT